MDPRRALHLRFLPLLVLVICAYLCPLEAAVVSGIPESGFQLDLEQAYSQLYYTSAFTNLDGALLATLYGKVSAESSNLVQLAGPRGCESGLVCAGVLVLFNVGTNSSWATCLGEKDAATCVVETLRATSVPLEALRAEGYTLSLVLDARASTGRTVNYLDIIRAANAYNAAADALNLPSISSLVSQSTGWPAETRYSMIPAANLSLVHFDVADQEGVRGDWVRVVSHATFNLVRWRLGYTYPMRAVEIRDPVPALYSRGTSQLLCAANDTADVVCLPTGAWTAWGSIYANTSWAWDGSTHRFSRTTAPGTTALFVPTSVPSFSQSGNTPQPEGPASAVVTALMVLDTVRRVSSSLGVAPPVYVFFVPGEWAGNVGSARLFHDTYFPPACESDGPAACAQLLYGEALNFTALNFDHVDRVISIDHLDRTTPESSTDALDRASLCFHIDDRVADVPGNAKLLQDIGILRKVRLQRVNHTVLEQSPSGLYAQFRSADLRANVSALTISSFCESSEPSRSGRSVSGEPDMNVVRERVQRAAVAITQLILGDVDIGPVDELFTTSDLTRLDGLLHCFTSDFNCSLLSGFAPLKPTPDYSFCAFERGCGSSLETLLSSAMRLIGLTPLKHLAVSPRLVVPPANDTAYWLWDAQSHADTITPDTVLVESIVPFNRGVRLVTVASRSSSTAAVLLSLVSVTAVSLLVIHYVFL